jgi:hypothetical protein
LKNCQLVVIDSSNETTLAGEYLLNNSGCLEITKKYPALESCKSIYQKQTIRINLFRSFVKENPELKKLG